MMSDFELKIIIAVAVGGLFLMIGLFIHFRYKMSIMRQELEDALVGCEQYQTIVQSVDEEGNPVLMFRDEPNKATVVHKYKSCGLKEYTAGQTETLIYSDEREFSLIADDNPYYLKMFRFTRLAVTFVMLVPLIAVTVALILILT
jgi:hypothetical protein